MAAQEESQELRALIEERVAAVARRDTAALATAQADDVLAFNVLPPLALVGAGVVASQAQAWFDAYADGPGYDVRLLRVDAGAGLGYCAFVYHVTGTLHSGDEVSMWVRATLIFRKVDGRWIVVHAHESIPWDAQTGLGLPGLEPDENLLGTAGR